MNELPVPEQLKGPWDHALILTYGVDIPFFEHALFSQFSARCRNKIILADGMHFLEACSHYAQSEQVRHLNHWYIAEGMFVPQAAHAKLILLTNPDQGRLLIGSGNVSWEGYASGGEMFSVYEYTAQTPDTLSAFIVVREVIESLTASRSISASAQRHIRLLLEGTPWLYQALSPQAKWWPVRHNLKQSFLEQLQEVIHGRPVEEVWILSPFYDKEAKALERLLTVLSPMQATILIQSRCTSLDPLALQRVITRFPDICAVRPFKMGSVNPYIHAKLYLVKLADQAICLQGSPNLSQVAMLLPHPQGNLELANLLVGPRESFDYLLEALDLQQATNDISEMGLAYEAPEEPQKLSPTAFFLTSGEWLKERLSLSYKGTLPNLEGASVVIGDRPFSIGKYKQSAQVLEIELTPEAAVELEQPKPVCIRWGHTDDVHTSNPIFVCNRAALERELLASDQDEIIKHISDGKLGDEEIDQLLEMLNQILLVDRHSVWQLAGKGPQSTTIPDEEDEALRLDYNQVDYDALRNHPKILQYHMRGGPGQNQTKLQRLLQAITDHFQNLMEGSKKGRLQGSFIPDSSQENEASLETPEEGSEQEESSTYHPRPPGQRLQQVLKNFIRRYLRGIRSPDFQEFAGFEIMVQNYRVFAFLLWRLFSKEWVEREFLVDAQLQTWQFFWGDGNQPGYVKSLPEDLQAQVLQLVRSTHADAELLAGLYYSTHLCTFGHWEQRRFALRDFLRQLLSQSLFEVTEELLEGVWVLTADLIRFNSPTVQDIVQVLSDLAKYETRTTFVKKLQEHYQFPPGSCKFTKATVYRNALGAETAVDCLELPGENTAAGKEFGLAVLQAWIKFERLEYYRLTSKSWLLYYDVLEPKVLYNDAQGRQILWSSDLKVLGHPDPTIAPQTSWESILTKMAELAQEIDAKMTQAERMAG